MKRKASVLIAAIVIGLLLNSCADKTPPAGQPQAAPELTCEAAGNLFSQAWDLFAWYYLGIMEVDGSRTITENNTRYSLCIDDRLPENCDLDGLRAYFANWFAAETVDRLFREAHQFVEKEGALYAAGNGCGSNPFHGEKRVAEEIEKLSDTELRLVVYVELLDDGIHPSGDEAEYPLELILENGKWVFRDYSEFADMI